MPYKSDAQRKAVWASRNERGESPVKKVRKTEKGASLKRWFKEEWTDVKTGKPCGRRKGERSKIREKTSLGQPAGKPRRVSPVTMKSSCKY